MRFRSILLAALVALAGPAVAWGQVVTTGTIQVTVVDADDAPLPGARVQARAEDTVTRRESFTNAQGIATLAGLTPSRGYVINVELTGFSSVRREEILVRSGQTTNLDVMLQLGGVEEVVTVTAETPLVDTRSAMTGQDLSLRLTEALPTGRSYQDYLQLVPGVMPDYDGGNPASKSGLNYADIGGTNGTSRDNFYYIDGINVTDPVTGTFGANLNTEIIQEQSVKTGGLSAEYAGAPGLVSSVTTKSGTNNYRGSVNYYFQNDGLVGENENAAQESFSTFDTAATFGGPIVRDSVWFFGSYRRIERDDDVVSLDTDELIRSVSRTDNQFYGRGSWSPRGVDTLNFTFLNDPTTFSGRRDRDITNARDRGREQGGNNYSVDYSTLIGDNTILDLTWNKHNGEVSDFAAIREVRNDVIFRAGDQRTQAEEELGGFGSDLVDERDTQLFKGSAQVNFQSHEIRTGFEYLENTNFQNNVRIGGAQRWVSFAPGLAGLTAGEIGTNPSGFSDVQFNPFFAPDFNGLVNAFEDHPDRDRFFELFDVNSDGTITMTELGDNLVFDSSEGNPDEGRINYSRVIQTRSGAQETRSEGATFYLQDTWQLTDRLVANVGFRTERFEHFGDTGDSIFTFDWTFAPRVSAIYDLMGDGRQKVSFFYGRYYDPIRMNMTDFAGSQNGEILEEQVFVDDQWVTFRVRGPGDAIFSPNTETPWTEDIQLGYEIDLGRNMSLEALYTHRRTRDIMEDFDLSLYAFRPDGTTSYPGPVDHPDSLFLGIDFFGFDEFPRTNFVIMTLPDGRRDYDGVEFTFRKRFSDNWQAIVAYTFNDASGNTNSDSNADFQGDAEWWDPRAPNVYGKQAGSIDHVFKGVGSYMFDFGLQVGGVYRWNSGTTANRTFRFLGRNIPVFADDPFEFAGFENTWFGPDSIGTFENPSFGILDLRAQYQFPIYERLNAEVFLDVFNVFDNQDANRLQDILSGVGDTDFGEGIAFNTPRRLFLGGRVNF